MDAQAELLARQEEPGTRAPIDRGVATARGRLVADRLARWAVTAGGLAIIAGILGILLFIVVEVQPLFEAATVTPAPVVALGEAAGGALVGDEHRTHVATLGRDGRVRVYRASDWNRVFERDITGGVPLERVGAAPGLQLLAGSTADGKVLALPVDWDVSFADGQRVVAPRIGEPVAFSLDPTGGPVGVFAVRLASDGSGTAAGRLADGTLVLVRREVVESLLTGEAEETWTRSVLEAPRGLSALVLDEDAQLYGGTDAGELVWWKTAEGGSASPEWADVEGPPVTALGLLTGGRSLVVGRADGTLGIWFLTRRGGESLRLTPIRAFPAQPDAIRLIAPSPRGMSFLAQDDGGQLGLYHSTSHRVLWQDRSPLPGATALFFAPKADGAYLAGDGRLASLAIHNPHPEVSLKALFGRVWYEGADEPAFVWQSSGSTDDFEPKLNLTPLMAGTLKGTCYSLVLAIPLAVLAAMYTSQFMHPRLKRTVKPVVEIMAALPSVVLGFVAGLWLAPRMEKVFPGLLLMALLLPPLVLAVWAALRTLPVRARKRMVAGMEVIPYTVAMAAGVWACVALSGPFERLAFGGSFQAWLLETTGLRFDQRNAVVVGLAMGFAVIPVIFAIAEDAFSNVPRNLVSGSLALGANRWQTVTRVVLPTASPGIFSAVMVGFGRAVGETMIVLMATGNTPILDWNPFNGFRTLSANIAVEIPEAPVDGTLYRTLFLAALILFVMTFCVNTLAEVIRQRLRTRYSQG